MPHQRYVRVSRSFRVGEMSKYIKKKKIKESALKVPRKLALNNPVERLQVKECAGSETMKKGAVMQKSVGMVILTVQAAACHTYSLSQCLDHRIGLSVAYGSRSG